MPDNIVERPGEREDSKYRFVVLGHPELGEFVDWDVAVAKAWTVTPAGGTRVEVTLAQKGVQQFRTSDPDADEPNLLDGITFDDDLSGRIHQVQEFVTDGTDLLVAYTYCGQSRASNQWSTYNKAIDGDSYSPCEGCGLRFPEHTVLDREDSSASVHIVVRAQEDVDDGAYQLRCGRIALWRDCMDVPDPKNSCRCAWCFDPLNPEPAKPVRW